MLALIRCLVHTNKLGRILIKVKWFYNPCVKQIFFFLVAPHFACILLGFLLPPIAIMIFHQKKSSLQRISSKSFRFFCAITTTLFFYSLCLFVFEALRIIFPMETQLNDAAKTYSNEIILIKIEKEAKGIEIHSKNHNKFIFPMFVFTLLKE